MIFIDCSIPRAVAEALKAVRNDVLWLEDQFALDTKDRVWLAAAGANEWLVISRDKKVITRPGERAAIMENNVGCFIIAQKQNLTKWDYFKLLAKTIDGMEERFLLTPRPFIYKVGANGDFKLV